MTGITPMSLRSDLAGMCLIAPVSATPMRSDVAVLLGMDSVDNALLGNTFSADVGGHVAQRSQL
jgi:hypothetical protein